MDIEYRLMYEDLRVFIPVVGGLIGFIIFWFTWMSEKFQANMIERFGKERGLANIIIYTKILGGITMGIMPAVLYLIVFPETTLTDLGLGLSRRTLFATIFWTFGLGFLMAFLAWQNARKPATLLHYPQIRARKWTRKMMQGNLLGWTLYLTGYEFLFRGVLLFPLVAEIGLWPAIAVNIAIYSSTHIPKGLKETVGAIPLCIVLCLVCVYTGNIWVAVFVHIAMAFTNTLTAFHHHPDMEFIND